MDGFLGTPLASDPFGDTFAVAGRGGREVRFRRLATAFAGLDGFAELLLSQREPVLALEHPNLVGTVAIARDGKGRLIVAEGLPSGASLAECLELAARAGGGLTRAAALDIARSLVAGLAHLHAAGLAHGLVHPRSLYVDPGGAVRLGDVAVARAAAIALANAAELRALVEDDLAPGGGEPVDARLDVHRAGALIRALLAGSELPASLVEVIDRATASDPRERHADAAELLVHLEEAIDPVDLPEARQSLAALVAAAMSARAAVEAAGLTDSAELPAEVARFARAGTGDPAGTGERPAARPAAITVERPAAAPPAGLLARVRALPRAAVLLVAAESALALLLVAGLMSDPDPVPAPAPVAATQPALSPPRSAPVTRTAAGPLAPPPAAEVEGSPARCVLHVRSNPPDATVSVDGLTAGITPVAVVGAPCGLPVTVGVDKVGFEGWRRQVRLVAGEPFHLQAALQRPRVTVRITSSPAGAHVSINGKPLGKTPLAVELTASASAGVLLQLRGYRPYRASLVPSGQRELAAQLVPLRRSPAGRPAAASSGARTPRARTATMTQVRR